MKLSVIIPIYNKVAYVERCLRQTLAQDMDDFEVVAVDDGSTDGSGAVCDAIAREDRRLRVWHVVNGGVTAARRFGVEQARGRYVVFVDSDDMLCDGALRTLCDAIERTAADEVIGTFRLDDGTPSGIVYEGLTAPDPLAKDILLGRNRFPVLWAVIFRRPLLDGCLDTPRDIIEGEDKLMQLKVLMKRPRVWFVSDCVYQYTADVPNTRRRTRRLAQRYDALLRQTIAPRWVEYRQAYYIHKVKELVRRTAPFILRLRRR